MSDVSQGWTKISILDAMEEQEDGRLIHQGWSPKCEGVPSASENDWGALKTTAIQDGAFHPIHNKKLPKQLTARPKLEVKKGDILLTCAGPRIRCGVACLVRETRPKLFISGKMYRFRAREDLISPVYLEGFLRSPETQLLIDKMKTGISESGMNITHEKFSKLIVPLPPLSEQHRITHKLDIVLERINCIKTRLDRLPKIFSQFRQSVLAAATCGKLTEEWRAINVELLPETAYAASLPPKESIDIPETWRWVSVRELSSKVTDGVHKKPNYIESGIPFLSIKNLTSGEGIDFSKTNYVSESDHKEFCKRTKPEKDDILITKDGTLGVIRRIDSDIEFSIFVSLALVKLKDKATAKYIEIAFNSPVVQKQLVGVGTGLLHIHLKDLRDDVIPIPPKREQEEIVRRVEKLLSFADNMAARYKTARTQVDKLTPALLAKAFRGELVEQDPNDEPAEKLLERIKVNNIVAAQTKKAPAKKAAKRK